MLRVSRQGLAVVASISLLAIASTAAEAARLAAQCQTVKELGQVHCDVRAFDYLPHEQLLYSSVTVTRGDGRTITPQSVELFDKSNLSSVWLFLVQETAHPKDSVRALAPLTRAEGKRRYGIAAFSDRVQVLAPLGASENDIRLAENKVSFRQDANTQLYYATKDAITRLANYTIDGKPAERKALVLFADGRSDSESYVETQKKEIADLAKQKNVMIYGVFSEGSRSNAGNIQELVEATNGVRINCRSQGAPRCVMPSDYAGRFHDYLENGLVLKFAAADLPDKSEITITVNYASAPPARAERVSVRPGPQISDLPWWQQPIEWANQNKVSAGAITMLMGLLVLGAAMMAWRQRRIPVQGGEGRDDHERTERHDGDRPTVITDGDTIIMTPTNDRNPPQHIYGWLQFLDASSTRVPIGTTSVRIGRHEDNDIRLQNKTVHRQHAVLHRTPHGGFTIQDLGGSNGVLVNNKRRQQAELTDGDLIELGEVRVRFFSNPQPTAH